MKIFIPLLFFISFLSIHAVEACSPAPGWPLPLEEHYTQSPTVFVGTVQSVVQDKSVYGDYRIMFDVARAYKNTQEGTSQVILVRGSSAACGYDDAYSVFPIGSVWAIYADETFESGSLSQNTQYNSIADAIKQVDSIMQEEKPTMCPMHYAPVCGRIDTGIRCVTTPCHSTEDITYGNACMMQGSGAEFLYEGECVSQPTPSASPAVEKPQDVSVKPLIPPPYRSVAQSPLPTPPSDASTSLWDRFIEALVNIIFFWK